MSLFQLFQTAMQSLIKEQQKVSLDTDVFILGESDVFYPSTAFGSGKNKSFLTLAHQMERFLLPVDLLPASIR